MTSECTEHQFPKMATPWVEEQSLWMFQGDPCLQSTNTRVDKLGMRPAQISHIKSRLQIASHLLKGRISMSLIFRNDNAESCFLLLFWS